MTLRYAVVTNIDNGFGAACAAVRMLGLKQTEIVM
jgi:NCAIR mutase (PurE)-related protein